MWKGWSLLDEVVADELEFVALGKDYGFVMHRAVFEMEHELIRDHVPAGDLIEISVSQDFAIERAQNKKTVDKTFGITHSYLLGEQARTWQQEQE